MAIVPLVDSAIDYTLWHPDLEDWMQGDIIQEYLQFSNEDPDDLRYRIDNFKHLTANEFNTLGNDFYELSNTYIYDILGGNKSTTMRSNLINQFLPGFLESVKRHPHISVADFGGGVGAVCSIMATMVSKVTYIDLDTQLSKFACHRFATRREPVEVLLIPKEDFYIPDKFDLIYTDAVWEHLPPVQQIGYLAKLVTRLSTHGVLAFLVDLSGEDVNMPMHFNVDIALLHDTLRYMNMNCLTGLNTFASIWQKI